MTNRNWCVLALLATGVAADAQTGIGIITTYSNAVVNPVGIATDGSGNLYIASDSIRQINAGTGILTIVAGGGTGGDGGPAVGAYVSGPCDVKVDASGNLYLSETCLQASSGTGGGGGGTGTGGISRIRRVDAQTGIITTIAGASSSGFAGDGGSATSALLNQPIGLAIDATGNIFVADAGNNRIRRIDAVSGIITTVAGNGIAAFSGDGGPATAASLNMPSFAAFDAGGNLYISDSANHRIRRVDAATGLIATVAGTGSASFNGDGIPAASATLNQPFGLTFGPSGNLIVADFGNNRVRTIDTAGLIWTIAGDGFTSPGPPVGDNGQASYADLNSPVGVAINPSGSLFISEIRGNRIRKVALPGSLAATALTVSANGTQTPVTFTVSVTAANGLGSNATGAFGIFDGLTPVGYGSLVNGTGALTPQISLGAHNISAAYIGDANFGASISSTVALTLANPPTTVALSVSANPTVANQPITLTSSVSPISATGWVTFFNGTASLGSSQLSNGVATLLSTNLPPVAGSYSLTAQYSGDGIHPQTTSPATSLVIQNRSAILVTSNANPSTAGQAVTFTAVIAPAAASNGTVQFLDNGTVIGLGALTSGPVSFSTTSLSAGQHAISAVYTGDQLDTSATSVTITQTVLGATSVALAASLNPALSNTSVTFTAAVTPATATGTMQFLDGGAALGTASISGGSAQFSSSALNQATHSITAVYSGDANNAASTSSALAQVMKSAAGLTGSATNPAIAGQAVVLTASLNAAATGSVQFLDGSTVLGTVAVAAGTASYSTSTLAQGAHVIGLNYSGDSSYMSASTTAPLTVLSLTTTTLASGLNPSTAGQPVSFTASVTPATSTGTVQFLDGSTLLGTATLTPAGTAFWTAPGLALGAHALQAVYSGDVTHYTSTGTLSQSVKSSASVNVAVSANPVVAGQTLTLVASVTSGATGTVQFVDGTTVLATISLSPSSTATYSTSTLALGSHVIAIGYSGDANYSSGSNSVTVSVLSATTTTLISSANPSLTGQSVTLSASVTPAASTGSIVFSDGSTVLATVALNSGVAIYTTAGFAAGNHALQASYAGDSTHASSSTNLSQAVKSPAGLTAALSPNPAVVGQTVTLTATVNAAATGTVSFTDGANTLGSAAVSAGRATYSTTSLSAGAHSIGFSYSGDTNYVAASLSLPQTMLAASSVALSASANPATVGQNITFTATVTPASATGTVQLLDGGAVIGTASLASGRAAFSLASLTLGSHSLSATYGGDGNTAPASSPALTEVVNAPAPPAAPSNLTAAAAGSSQINLAWTASATSGVTYNVYASKVSGFTPSASNRIATGVTGTSYPYTGLTASTTYYFRVTAASSAGESAASNQSTATTSGGTACHVSYSVSSQWNVGFNGAFSIQNTGSTPLNSWNVTWSWAGNQKVTQSWNASYNQSGANVTMTNMSYNNSIAPGATLSGMGFGASYSGANTSPTAFYVNGTKCQ